MRYLTTAFLTLALAGPAAASDRLQSFATTYPAAGLKGVELAAGVGSVEFQSDPGAEVGVEVDVVARRFAGRTDRRGRRLLDELELHAETRNGVLTVRLLPEQRGRREFNEEWIVRLPPELAVSVKLGVGDVRILDMTGDVDVSLGVGDVSIEGAHTVVGPIRASCGVGNVMVRTPEGRERGSGFIAKSLNTSGTGNSSVSVSVGVGDVSVRLR